MSISRYGNLNLNINLNLNLNFSTGWMNYFLVITTLILPYHTTKADAFGTNTPPMGCIPFSDQPTTTAYPTGTSLTSCQSACFGANPQLAYCVYDATNGCYGTTAPGPTADFQPQNTGDGTCATQYSTVFITSSTFKFQGCYSTFSGNGEQQITPSPNNPKSCFTSCAGYQSSAWRRYQGTYVCWCYNGFASSTASNCEQLIDENSDKYAYYAYNHNAIAQASLYNRRRTLEQRNRLLGKNERLYCPSHLKACVVNDVEGGYECVDTQNEAESCGGCIYGEFGGSYNATESVGVDCTRAPGVRMGAANCIDGVCQADACKWPYRLVNGQCVMPKKK